MSFVSFTQRYIFSENKVSKVTYSNTARASINMYVTLIFSKWRTPWFVANNKLDDPLKCKSAWHDSEKEQFLRNSVRDLYQMQSTMSEMQFLNLSSDVAMMLRIEQMLLSIKMNGALTNASRKLPNWQKINKELAYQWWPWIWESLGVVCRVN